MEIKATHYIENANSGSIYSYLVEKDEIKYWDLWGNLVYSSKDNANGLILVPDNTIVKKVADNDGTYSYFLRVKK